MQAINGIQNAMINTNAGAQGGMVVDAACAHRTYFREEHPVSMRPNSGVFRSLSKPGSAIDLKPRLQLETTGLGSGDDPQTTRSGRTWRLDNRHLPEAAWAMLVLNRSLCG
ncbi:MAG: hypothetical protein JSS49_27345 [Planctomycetes bacterium]|nr:hypothetical protein [Planctomycetota bacterium]